MPLSSASSVLMLMRYTQCPDALYTEAHVDKGLLTAVFAPGWGLQVREPGLPGKQSAGASYACVRAVLPMLPMLQCQAQDAGENVVAGIMHVRMIMKGFHARRNGGLSIPIDAVHHTFSLTTWHAGSVCRWHMGGCALGTYASGHFPRSPAAASNWRHAVARPAPCGMPVAG